MHYSRYLFLGFTLLCVAFAHSADVTVVRESENTVDFGEGEQESAVRRPPTIVVTAAPLPKYRVALNDSGTLIDLPPEKAPFTVDTLTEDFIRERNVTDLDQLLALQPGIYQGGKTMMSRNAGTYTIKVLTTKGEYASTTFQILTTAQASASPRTGDDSNIALWSALVLMSGAAMVAVLPRLKKEN